MPLIECKNVSLSYDNNTVVSDLSFSVGKGDYLCIVGNNGSGKSTLVRALLSLKGVNKGKIVFGDGLEKNEIGYLPQQHMLQKDFPANVFEVVLSGCLNSKRALPFYNKNDKARAAENMEKLGISKLKKHPYRELSGGQQQRVLLARALCATKKVILLDEPTSGLDPAATGEFYSLIKKINDEGITVIMVSHDVKSVLKYATHILHLHDNSMFFGSTKEYTESDVGKAFIGGADNV